MPQYVIEREIPNAGKLTDDELRAVSLKSIDTLSALGPQIQWIPQLRHREQGLLCLPCAGRSDGTGTRAAYRHSRQPRVGGAAAPRSREHEVAAARRAVRGHSKASATASSGDSDHPFIHAALAAWGSSVRRTASSVVSSRCCCGPGSIVPSARRIEAAAPDSVKARTGCPSLRATWAAASTTRAVPRTSPTCRDPSSARRR